MCPALVQLEENFVDTVGIRILYRILYYKVLSLQEDLPMEIK